MLQDKTKLNLGASEKNTMFKSAVQNLVTGYSH